MNKKAWTISWAEMMGLLLVVFVIITFLRSDAFASVKKIVGGGRDDAAIEQMDNLVEHIKNDIESIRRPGGIVYPLGADGNKYSLVVKNCATDDNGNCEERSKTKLCLRNKNTERYSCSKKSLNYLVYPEFYAISGMNLRITWENNRLMLS